MQKKVTVMYVCMYFPVCVCVGGGELDMLPNPSSPWLICGSIFKNSKDESVLNNLLAILSTLEQASRNSTSGITDDPIEEAKQALSSVTNHARTCIAQVSDHAWT